MCNNLIFHIFCIWFPPTKLPKSFFFFFPHKFSPFHFSLYFRYISCQTFIIFSWLLYVFLLVLFLLQILTDLRTFVASLSNSFFRRLYIGWITSFCQCCSYFFFFFMPFPYRSIYICGTLYQSFLQMPLYQLNLFYSASHLTHLGNIFKSPTLDSFLSTIYTLWISFMFCCVRLFL